MSSDHWKTAWYYFRPAGGRKQHCVNWFDHDRVRRQRGFPAKKLALDFQRKIESEINTWLRPVADALDLALGDASADDHAKAIAEALRSTYRAAGMPTRLRDLDVLREDFDLITADTQKNFNANPGMRDEDAVGEMLAILEAAW